MRKIIAIIPARGGSKRIPGKNLVHLANVPLILYSINYAKINPIIDDVYVSTDSKEIADFTLLNETKVLYRPEMLAMDSTSTIDVLKYHVSKDENIFHDNDLVVVLQPTNPLRLQSLLNDAIMIMEAKQVSSLATFSPLNKKFGRIVDDHFIPSNYTVGQRMQDIEPSYFENGLLYISQVDQIKTGILISKNTYPMITRDSFSYVDIDEKEDLLFAEFMIEKNGIEI